MALKLIRFGTFCVKRHAFLFEATIMRPEALAQRQSWSTLAGPNPCESSHACSANLMLSSGLITGMLVMLLTHEIA